MSVAVLAPSIKIKVCSVVYKNRTFPISKKTAYILRGYGVKHILLPQLRLEDSTPSVGFGGLFVSPLAKLIVEGTRPPIGQK